MNKWIKKVYSWLNKLTTYKDTPRVRTWACGNACYDRYLNQIVIYWNPAFAHFIDNEDYLSTVLEHEVVHWVLLKEIGKEASNKYDYFFGNTIFNSNS